MLRLDILTLFPGLFSGFLDESIPRIAQEKGSVQVRLHNIRDWSLNKHAKVDDRPFGGGPGMVMTCQPLVDAVEAVLADGPAGRLIFLTPEGRPFRQPVAEELSREERLILVCGRYEGFDERIFDILRPERLSVGDFVLSGGEVAAMAVADAVIRLLPDVLGCSGSAVADSFSSAGILDHPHYTQPPEYRGLVVPEVLRGGNHALIDAWRRERALERTRLYRPDLLRE